MKTGLGDPFSRICVGVVVIVQFVLCASAAVPLRVEVPPDPYAPVWVRPMWAESDQDMDVAVWVFYRAPECVPLDFDIWQFFDWSDRDGNGMPDPWDYPLLMRGFEIFSAPPPTPPFKSLLREIDEVPLWFTTREEANEVLNRTGAITMEELSQMRSLLKGSATFYHEELHNALGGKAQVWKGQYYAKGMLEDGRSFSVHIVANLHGERENYILQVEFK